MLSGPILKQGTNLYLQTQRHPYPIAKPFGSRAPNRDLRMNELRPVVRGDVLIDHDGLEYEVWDISICGYCFRRVDTGDISAYQQGAALLNKFVQCKIPLKGHERVLISLS